MDESRRQPERRSAAGMTRVGGWYALAAVAGMAVAGCGGHGGSSTPGGGGGGGEVTLQGTVTFDLVPAVTSGSGAALDYAHTEARPARGVTVQVVSGADVLGTTTTDGAGAYSFTVASGSQVLLRTRAEMVRTGGPGWNVRVVDNTDADALFVLDTPAFTVGNSDTTRNVHAASGWDGSKYSAARSAAPFAILDTIYTAMQFALASEPGLTFPDLVVHRSTKNKPSLGADGSPDLTTGEIGSSFYGGGVGLYLLGAENDDTDEYDRSVISHEWGHYLDDSFGRDDSIGGSHTRNDQLDLRVAFSEGWATAVSAMTTGDSVYRDTSFTGQSRGFTFDEEGPPFFDPKQHPGWYSEESVQELIYDLYDANADLVGGSSTQDNVALGFGPIYAVLAGTLHGTLALASVFPFVNALQTAQPQDAASIDELVRAEGMDSIVDDYGSTETHFGSPATSDLTTVYDALTVNGGATNVCSLDDFKSKQTGSVNKLGSRRFLRFAVATAGAYTLTATAVAPLNAYADPDMVLHQVGAIDGSNGPPSDACKTSGTATPSLCNESFTATLSPGDYVLEVYEWTNTTSDPAYPPIGRTCFDVTVTGP